MSKFIITYKKTIGTTQKEFNTPEEAIAALNEKTIEIKEQYPNGEAIVYKSNLEDMIAQKKIAEECEN